MAVTTDSVANKYKNYNSHNSEPLATKLFVTAPFFSSTTSMGSAYHCNFGNRPSFLYTYTCSSEIISHILTDGETFNYHEVHKTIV